MFWGRKSELEQIKSLINSNRKRTLMIYGKRRVGKSALIIEAVKSCNCKVIYYECMITSIAENLRNLEKRVQDVFANKYLHFESFKELFDFLGSRKEKTIIILDEYSYLKKLATENYIDSMFQSIIDQMHDNITLVLLGSYVGIMKELLEKENPLFGRFSLVMNLKPFDYYDASLFYNNCRPQQKIDFYSVFGGSPFVCSFIEKKHTLEKNIINLLLNPDSVLRIYVENILLAELSKLSNANLILSTLSNGKKRYSDLESSIGIKTNGNLDKQLKNLSDMEIVGKVFPINKRDDKKKTFYEISDNLIRFYYLYVFKNQDIITRIGGKAFFKEYIEPTLATFISHRFENIVREFFSRCSRMGLEQKIHDIGTYWYDLPVEHKNGEFDCVVKRDTGYSVYEVKYYQKPLTKKEADNEFKQVKAITADMQLDKIGFIALSGFDFTSKKYELISAEKLYDLSLE